MTADTIGGMFTAIVTLLKTLSSSKAKYVLNSVPETAATQYIK